MKDDVVFSSYRWTRCATATLVGTAFENRCFVTAAQAAGLLGMGNKTFARHVARGRIAFVLHGHGTKRPRRRFTREALLAFIDGQTRVMRDVACSVRVNARPVRRRPPRAGRRA